MLVMGDENHSKKTACSGTTCNPSLWDPSAPCRRVSSVLAFLVQRLLFPRAHPPKVSFHAICGLTGRRVLLKGHAKVKRP